MKKLILEVFLNLVLYSVIIGTLIILKNHIA